MSIQDICLMPMQQQVIERNQGTTVFTIKIHPQCHEEESYQVDECLTRNMSIKDLKCYILKLVDQAFFLKFHMQNDQTLGDLEQKTKQWNSQHGIDYDDTFLPFDVFLDRDNYDLIMEIEMDSE